MNTNLKVSNITKIYPGCIANDNVSLEFKSGKSDIWGLQYHPEISYDKMISLIKFRKEKLIKIRKCFESEEEVKNHINFIQKENEKTKRNSRMIEIKNWLLSLN